MTPPTTSQSRGGWYFYPTLAWCVLALTGTGSWVHLVQLCTFRVFKYTPNMLCHQLNPGRLNPRFPLCPLLISAAHASAASTFYPLLPLDTRCRVACQKNHIQKSISIVSNPLSCTSWNPEKSRPSRARSVPPSPDCMPTCIGGFITVDGWC